MTSTVGPAIRSIASAMADSVAASRKIARSWPIYCAAIIGRALLLPTLGGQPRPLLVWNPSPSSPLGLYAISPTSPGAGDFALAWAPLSARRLAAARDYLPFHIPLVKGVAGGAGDRVCAKGASVFVNGRLVATRRGRDPSGRPMPWWMGCRRLHSGEYFLISVGEPLAFDGRYFGITNGRDLIGRARLLWKG
jgi:type IV secretory pathway protease TraF